MDNKVKMKEETKLWLNKSKDDLKKAKSNFKIKNYDVASFLCQQAVEKGLKAVLIERTNTFPKIHDLVRLGKLVSLSNNLLKDCEVLNPVYIETRYPIFNRKYSKKEATKDIKNAEGIIKWIKKNL